MQNLIDRGLVLHRAGQLAQAEPLYRQVLRQQPDHPVALHLMGVMAIQSGRFDQAVDWLTRAIAAQPAFPEALSNLGNAYKALGRPDQALEAYGRALALREAFPEAHNNSGVCLQALGRIDAALAAFERALTLNPNYPEAVINRAAALERQGRMADAADGYRTATALAPDNADLHNALGNALRAAGRLAEAAEAYGAAARRRPDFCEFHVNHGVALTECRRLDPAVAALRTALALAPGHPRAGVALGVALDLQGKTDEAIAGLEDVLAAHPDFLPAHGNLGLALAKRGRLEEAAQCQRDAIRLRPDYAVAHNNLGVVLTQMGRLDAALAAIDEALRLRPDFPEALLAKGNLLKGLGRLEEAAEQVERALALKPDSAEAHAALGSILQGLWRLDEAVARNRQALALWPDFPAALIALGNALQMLGRIAEAARCYETILAAQPDHGAAHGNLLNAVMYRDDLTAAQLRDIHLRSGAAMAQAPLTTPPLAPAGRDDGERRLRIGYLSSDLRNHPVATNLLPVIRAHDRAQVSVGFYAHVTQPDSYTEQFKAQADSWRDIAGLTDRQAAEAIRADGIDILVSLAGRFDLNRPGICAYRAAPVQISLHEVATSGLAEMDYLIGDGCLLARPSLEHFTERRLRLPSFYIADFPARLPPLPDQPRQGPVVFSCFNNPAKISPATTRLWGVVLAALPDSRLVLKFQGAYGSDSLRQRLLGQLVVAGARADQVEFIAERDGYLEFLARYNHVDFALDTGPFSGSTTSFQALTMGVPVLTLPGERMVSRWTASMLRRLDLDGFIAASPEDFVARARDLAATADHWRARRGEIRERVRGSALCDAPRWTRNLERLYRAVWRRHCARDAQPG